LQKPLSKTKGLAECLSPDFKSLLS